MTTDIATVSSHPSLVSPERMAQENRKRPARIFVPKGLKKRRSIVNRTHSPRSESSPSSPYVNRIVETPPRKTRLTVKKLAPNLKGVTEAVRVLSDGEVVVIPTESVYMACTTISPSDLLASHTSLNHLSALCGEGDEPPVLLVKRPVVILDHLLSFKQKPYAIKEKDGKKSVPVVFSERREVVSRLAKKFWPGPMTLYLRTEDKNLPLYSRNDDKTYVGVSNPAHPLTSRVLKEVAVASVDRVVVGKPSLRNSSFMTMALDVCTYYASQFFAEKHTIHVLNGEDRRELFAVPTCQYGKPYRSSLWIDESCRTVYIRGTKDDDLFDEARILRTIGSSSLSPTQDDRLRNRDRVVTAVLRQWKVVDQRASPSTS